MQSVEILKTGLSRFCAVILLAGLLSACQETPDQSSSGKNNQPETTQSELEFSVVQGEQLNYFYRKGPVAAHVIKPITKQPFFRVAFPAGNSGMQIQATNSTTEDWGAVDNMTPIRFESDKERPFHGVSFDVSSAKSEVQLEEFLMGSIRTIRSFKFWAEEALKEFPVTIEKVSDTKVHVVRDRLDKKESYFVSVEVLNGSASVTEDNKINLSSDGEPLQLRISAATTEKTLSPIPKDALFRTDVKAEEETKNVLAFLSYDEKLLAGSWRYLTYFGRDTLISTKLLMPVASQRVVEAGIASTIERLNPNGEVAHEEDIGEQANLHRKWKDQPISGEPIYDYKMIDDNLMLLPIVIDFEQAFGLDALDALLARKTASGVAYREKLLRNLTFVMAEATPFAKDPEAQNMLHIGEGLMVGEWRDSGGGLGGGRIPYDVNAVLMPAALEASITLLEAGLFDGLVDDPAALLADARKTEAVWREKAPGYFMVKLDNAEAVEAITNYSAEIGVPADAALEVVGSGEVEFDALSLNADLSPVKAMHSDYSFTLSYIDPDEATLRRALRVVLDQFPAGLYSSVGVVVANPVYLKSAEARDHLDNDKYHGTVVWSWQQALLLSGLNRQIARTDISEEIRNELIRARDTIWQVVDDNSEALPFELWSWSYADGQFKTEPFGQREDDETESNAAQLWSAAFLGVLR